MRPSGRSASHTEPWPPLVSTLSQALLIDVEVYDAADVQVYQSYLDAEPFVAGVQR